MKWLEVEVNGSVKRVWAQRLGASLWYHVDGKTYEKVAETRKKRSRSKVGSTGTVPGFTEAPMPGKIIKVHVHLGAEVEVGEALVTMEAMKMEYCLKSDVAGEVVELPFQEGHQVSMGNLLARVNSKED